MATCVESDGERICPVLEFAIEGVSAVTTTSALATASLDELPLRFPGQHGFCWSVFPAPTIGESPCLFLGPALRLGPFSGELYSLRPGTIYFVRAFVSQDGEAVYSDELSFKTLLPEPTGVTASQGTFSGFVEVRWDEAEQALGYMIYRDGAPLVFVDDATLSFRDETATAASFTSPLELQATQGDLSHAVLLSWEAPVGQLPQTHVYSVSAIYPEAESPRSNEVEGFRGIPIVESYEIEFDEDGNWFDVGYVDVYEDELAESGTVEFYDAPDVSQTYHHRVIMEATNFQAGGPAVTYRVRARTDSGVSPASEVVQGWRGVGELTFQWQRSAGEENDNFSNLDGATTALFHDLAPPEPGEGRYYRVVVSPSDAPTVASPAALGTREPPPPRELVAFNQFGGSFWIFDTDGDRVRNNAIHPSFAYYMALDPEGRTFTGARNGVTKTFPWNSRKWLYSGHDDYVYGVAVDAQGYVYSASGDETVHKLDKMGDLVWVFTGHTAAVRAVAVDANGYVYTASDDGTVRKLDSDGNEIWSFDGHLDGVYRVAVDSRGNVFTGGFAEEPGNQDNSIRKLDPDGNELWVYTGNSAGVRRLVVDALGFVYAATGDEVHKIDGEGDLVWVFDGHGTEVRSITVDPEGFVYSHGNDHQIKKLDSAGTEIWSVFYQSGAQINIGPGLYGAFPELWY